MRTDGLMDRRIDGIAARWCPASMAANRYRTEPTAEPLGHRIGKQITDIDVRACEDSTAGTYQSSGLTPKQVAWHGFAPAPLFLCSK